MHKAEGISNAYQMTLKGPLLPQVVDAISRSEGVRRAVASTFGTDTFKVSNVKLLMAEFLAAAQIPHADDHCNRELFGICHLKSAQQQTHAMPYESSRRFPSGVDAQCELCKAWRNLPDQIARRREHMKKGYSCAVAGYECNPSGLKKATAQRRAPPSPLPSPPGTAPPSPPPSALLEPPRCVEMREMAQTPPERPPSAPEASASAVEAFATIQTPADQLPPPAPLPPPPASTPSPSTLRIAQHDGPKSFRRALGVPPPSHEAGDSTARPAACPPPLQRSLTVPQWQRYNTPAAAHYGID